MRYTILAVLAAVLLAPIVGCESKSTDKTTKNPITGSETHTHDTSVTGS